MSHGVPSSARCTDAVDRRSLWFFGARIQESCSRKCPNGLRVSSPSILSRFNTHLDSYSIIYTLFLGFSISIGSELWYLVDPKSKHDAAAAAVNTYTLDGTFAANNASQSFAGSWTFTNSTSSGTSTQASLQQGNVMCYRDPSWEWWRQRFVPYFCVRGRVTDRA